MASQEEWVEVLVPRQLVPEVYGLIAQRMTPGSVNGDAGINGGMVERMYVESPPAMKSFLKLLASQAGREFTTGEVCKALDLTNAQLAGVLGAFGRRRKNRYKGAEKPFVARWDHEGHTWTYKMPSATASTIMEAAGA